MSGWIKLHRKTLEHWVAQEPEMLAVWVRLLSDANHETKKTMFNGSLIEIKRGQVIFGLNAFSVKSGVSIKKLRRYMDMFEAEGMLGRQKTNKFSLISITKYDQYQDKGSQGASRGQAEGKQRATSKECKEVKEGKGSKKFTPPTPEQVYEYMKEKGLDSRTEANRFVNHHEQGNWFLKNGRKMSSWTAAVRVWLGNYGRFEK